MDDLLSLSRMSRRLGVTQTWLRGEVQAGRVSALQCGRRLLFNASQVEISLAKRAAGLTASGPAQSPINEEVSGACSSLIAAVRAKDRNAATVELNRLNKACAATLASQFDSKQVE